MSEEKKMFLCVKRSKWSFHISPQTGAGWRALGLWVLTLLPVIGLNIYGSAALEANGYSDNQIVLYVVPVFLLATGIWVIVMIRWMYNRSEIIDMADIAAWKAEKDAGKRERRPRS